MVLFKLPYNNNLVEALEKQAEREHHFRAVLQLVCLFIAAALWVHNNISSSSTWKHSCKKPAHFLASRHNFLALDDFYTFSVFPYFGKLLFVWIFSLGSLEVSGRCDKFSLMNCLQVDQHGLAWGLLVRNIFHRGSGLMVVNWRRYTSCAMKSTIWPHRTLCKQ